jgi:predicted flap endonuclease-1-like 5' DNA nuclease
MDDSTDLDTLRGLAAPARRALTDAGYVRLAQLADITEKQLSRLHGMGPNAVRVLREALAQQGLTFKGGD